MNLIYIHCHDAGRMMSPYGYALPTPNLERLASKSALFRQAFCAGPTCSPSRAGLLTGQWPHQTGMLGLAHRGFGLKDPSHHLAAYLKLNGWHTTLCGVQHEFAWNAPKPYDEIIETPDGKGFPSQGIQLRQQDRGIASNAAKFLYQQKAAAPFFLSCGFVLPHRDYPPADPNLPVETLRPPAPLPDRPEIRADWAEYAAAVQSMDECVGYVMTALRDSGLEKDTIVLFTTDHGVAFPHFKCNLTDAGMGVALMLQYPGNPAAGKAVDAMVSHVDVFPTLCELLKIPAPDWLEGKSMVPLCKGTVTSIRDELYGEVTFHAAYEPMRAVRTERYKLIRLFDPDSRPVRANCDDSTSKTLLLIESGLADKARPALQLYDLITDPLEQCNLANDSAYGTVLEDLTTRLKLWMERTNDPLLHGPVPPPKGSKVNPREHLSPGQAPVLYE